MKAIRERSWELKKPSLKESGLRKRINKSFISPKISLNCETYVLGPNTYRPSKGRFKKSYPGGRYFYAWKESDKRPKKYLKY